MHPTNKKPEQSKTSPITHPKSQKSSPKEMSTLAPSFTGISSNTTFEQTNGQFRISQSASSLSQSMHTLEDFIMVNDGVQYIFDFTQSQIDNDDVFDIFEDLAKEQDYQMIEREETYCTAIKQVKSSSMLSKMNITEWITGCFPFMADKSNTTRLEGTSATSKAPSAIKIVVSKIVHDNKQRKIARIKGLSGLVKEIRIFIQKFKQRMTHYLPEDSQQFLNCFIYDTQTETEGKKSSEISDPYHLQISTFYVIEKILSNDVYQIGGIAQALLRDYMNSFQNIQESVGLIPEPISNATKIVNEIYYWFSSINKPEETTNKKQLQIKKKTSKKGPAKQEKTSEKIKAIPLHESMTQFIRISIEKYVFQKLSYPIVDIYRMKNAQNEQIFIEKRARIFQKYSTKQIFDQISLNQKFWSVSKDRYKDLDHIHTRKQTRALALMSSQCCAQLQKISLTSNPREKIKYMELAYTSLKTFYYDFSKHKYQLSSMEDIIPVLILVVLLVNVDNLRTELDLMGDFIQSDPYEMQSQKRLYINLSESYNYVLRDWKI